MANAFVAPRTVGVITRSMSNWSALETAIRRHRL
jgi:hypothetical protein